MPITAHLATVPPPGGTLTATMARRFRHTALRRAADAAVRALLRLGPIFPGLHVLTVPGRRTGRPRSTPVLLIRRGGAHYLVAAYGQTGWVRNARAAGAVTLARGRRRRTVAVEELPAEDAGPVLRAYARRIPLVRPYFDASTRAPDAAWAVEAAAHPVFRLGAEVGRREA
jgi:deazaflavin-dependent oxidoreductase (nitroreductase family)